MIDRTITLHLTKSYTNGATHSFYSCDGLADARRAAIDAEDKLAGLVGTWNVLVIAVR